MYLGVKDVKPLPDYKVLLTFENLEKRIFDVSPYLNTGVFRDLLDNSQFQTVHVSFDTIQWNNGADLDPEVLYRDSKLQDSQDRA